ncbi:hypothetical protein SRABI128_03057 [Microbacterium sp. Bi128]|nr:hypothetical protein SRABI128_03057 [Microbacterium sp. Bi128]
MTGVFAASISLGITGALLRVQPGASFKRNQMMAAMTARIAAISRWVGT